jgi:Asp-tRNA(Asn)/Glu-tRNA(Gln) amidotransferase A subunit family amidase
MKPTYDLISRRGVYPLSWSLDHVGFFTRTVEDAAVMLEVMAEGGTPAGMKLFGSSPPRLGLLRGYFQQCADDEVWTGFEGAVESLRDAGAEVVETSLPAVITAQKGLNEPRYPTFKGIRAARKKPIHKKMAAELGVDPGVVGAAGAKLEIVSLSPPPERDAGQIIPGNPVEVCRKLVRLLREEAKVV